MGTNKGYKRQLELDDRRYLWPPFTQMQEHVKDAPLIIEEGYGCILKDIYGRAYIDGISSLWTNLHGHRKKQLDNALRKQIEKIAHSTMLGLSNVPAIHFAKEIIKLLPKGLTRVFYSDSGSTAVEIALKMAFQYHSQAREGDPKKTKFISMTNAYHGDTIGSVSVGGIDLFHATYKPLLFNSLKAESPYCYRCVFGKSFPGCAFECLENMESLLKHHGHEVAALIIEPMVQGAAGMLVQPPGYLRLVRDLCNKYKVFMIADEVAVGFGRTGRMFACEHEEVKPDIMALAKGITGGYLPLAATITTERIYEGFLGTHEEFKTFFHGHTYTGNPLACAVALANLKVFDEEAVVIKLQEKIALLTQRLKGFYSLEGVGDIRQSGFMVGIELVADRDSKKPYPVKDRVGHQVILEARKRGLILRPLGDVIIIMPPLGISIDELNKLCDITYESIDVATTGR